MIIQLVGRDSSTNEVIGVGVWRELLSVVFDRQFCPHCSRYRIQNSMRATSNARPNNSTLHHGHLPSSASFTLTLLTSLFLRQRSLTGQDHFLTADTSTLQSFSVHTPARVGRPLYNAQPKQHKHKKNHGLLCDSVPSVPNRLFCRCCWKARVHDQKKN